jgi:hypothetical protein
MRRMYIIKEAEIKSHEASVPNGKMYCNCQVLSGKIVIFVQHCPVLEGYRMLER